MLRTLCNSMKSIWGLLIVWHSSTMVSALCRLLMIRRSMCGSLGFLSWQSMLVNLICMLYLLQLCILMASTSLGRVWTTALWYMMWSMATLNWIVRNTLQVIWAQDMHVVWNLVQLVSFWLQVIQKVNCGFGIGKLVKIIGLWVSMRIVWQLMSTGTR